MTRVTFVSDLPYSLLTECHFRAVGLYEPLKFRSINPWTFEVPRKCVISHLSNGIFCMSASHTWFCCCCCCCCWCSWCCGSVLAAFLPELLWSSSMRNARRIACLRRPISTVPFKPCRSAKIKITVRLCCYTFCCHAACTRVQGRNWGGSKGSDQPPPQIFSDVEQIFSYRRGSSSYSWLEKLGPPPPKFFLVRTLHQCLVNIVDDNLTKINRVVDLAILSNREKRKQFLIQNYSCRFAALSACFRRFLIYFYFYV